MKPTTKQKPFRCHLGFHKWGAWKKLGGYYSPLEAPIKLGKLVFVEKTCEGCGEVFCNWVNDE